MFKPKNSAQDLEIKTAQYQINQTKIHEDPKKQLNPATYTVIKKEKRMRIFSSIFWGSIFFFSIIGILFNVFFHLESENKGIGFYILLSIPTIISFGFMTKSLIRVSGWKKAEASYRVSYSAGDSVSSSMFAEIYQSLVLKKLRMTWALIFFLTYFGLFNIIILALKDQVIEVGTNFNNAEVTNGFNIHFLIDFKKRFEITFGNVNVLLIVNAIVILSFVAIYILILLYDKKRIQDILMNLGSTENQTAVKNAVELKRKSENKAWIRTYIVIFVLVVLIPFVLILFLIYKKFIRKKA